MKNKYFFSIVYGLCAYLLFCTTCFSQTYKVSDDFSSTNNPNSVWSYGWSTKEGKEFNIYEKTSTFNEILLWIADIPNSSCVSYNPTNQLLYGNNGTNSIEAKSVGFHPGNNGERAIIRWTSPNSRKYLIKTIVKGRDHVYPTSTDVNILHNSKIIWSTNINSFNEPISFSKELFVNKGSYIDFSCGYGSNNTWIGDTTGIDIIITDANETELNFNAKEAFNNEQNPNGVWSYGWMDNEFNAFQAYTNSKVILDSVPVWFGNSDPPSIWKNTSKNNVYWGVEPNQLSLHPGPSQEPSVLRFTAPTYGQYSLSGQFFPGDSGSMKVAILQAKDFIWKGVNQGSFSFTRLLKRNETIDFAVYGGYCCGNTPLEVNISLLVSEPPVKGCLSVYGIPINQGSVSLIQSGEYHQKVSLDSDGCYIFERVIDKKPFSIIIRANE